MGLRRPGDSVARRCCATRPAGTVRPSRRRADHYFKVFEPLGLALWDSHDPVAVLEGMGGWTVERQTYFFGNFQVVTATKH